MRLRKLGLASVALVVAAIGCAAGEDDTAGGGRGVGGESSGGTPITDGAGGEGGTTTDGGAPLGGSGGEGGTGGALSGEVELCVLNEGEAFDPCQQPEELDFGVVSAGTTETRLFRIDNQTLGVILFKSADIADNQFEVAAVRFEEDPGDPGTYLRVEVDLPFERDSGESLWFEVAYNAVGNEGPLADEDVIVKMNLDDDPIADIAVPVVGEESGCPPGSGACDSDPNNGCETNTDSSNDHCGGCNTPCDPFGAMGSCVAGECQLGPCDALQANCDNDDATGCEVNLLNDLENCGQCAESCIKDNTDSFCNGGNCDIIGCLNNYGDCNLSPADGCETNLANTMAHCGGCNLNCDLANAAETCVPSQITGLGVCTLGACTNGFQNCDGDPSDGCEVNTTNDVANCGNCFAPCSYQNAAASCVNSGCMMGQCNQGYDNCNGFTADGCEVTLATDKDHCGTCATDCDNVFPGSSTSCAASTCVFNGCLPNQWNLDGNLANGCEYTCGFVSATDNPDDAFVDANCDGVDGDAANAIFVATTGNDAWPGTRTQPKLTVNAGIAQAVADSKDHVYISNGLYTGRVTLSNGISLYGGYSATANWARSSAYIATIRSSTVSLGRVTALEGTTISAATVVDRLTIETGNTSSAGINNYAVYCSGCTALTLRNNVITAGNAGPGGAGGGGGVGTNGSNGGGGGPGHCDNNSSGGAGGTAGGSSCRTGGAGGKGGDYGSNAGATGAQGQFGTAGGSGGSGGDPGSTGANGANGSSGGSGTSGGAGSGGAVSAGFWTTDAGGNGGTGGVGNGGGGGGGGGGQGCFFCNDGPGNGGGGGGGAGCGGGGATGGSGGGGSFGLFLVSSTGIILTGNSISAGTGGSGGTGGGGGGGGSGAAGGLGGTTCTSEVGKGGNGGAGGNGGFGGGGGGGAGGPSWGVYRSGTTVATAGNSISAGSPGSGGNGGSPNGNNGVAGASGNVN